MVNGWNSGSTVMPWTRRESLFSALNNVCFVNWHEDSVSSFLRLDSCLSKLVTQVWTMLTPYSPRTLVLSIVIPSFSNAYLTLIFAVPIFALIILVSIMLADPQKIIEFQFLHIYFVNGCYCHTYILLYETDGVFILTFYVSSHCFYHSSLLHEDNGVGTYPVLRFVCQYLYFESSTFCLVPYLIRCSCGTINTHPTCQVSLKVTVKLHLVSLVRLRLPVDDLIFCTFMTTFLRI